MFPSPTTEVTWVVISEIYKETRIVCNPHHLTSIAHNIQSHHSSPTNLLLTMSAENTINDQLSRRNPPSTPTGTLNSFYPSEIPTAIVPIWSQESSFLPREIQKIIEWRQDRPVNPYDATQELSSLPWMLRTIPDRCGATQCQEADRLFVGQRVSEDGHIVPGDQIMVGGFYPTLHESCFDKQLVHKDSIAHIKTLASGLYELFPKGSEQMIISDEEGWVKDCSVKDVWDQCIARSKITKTDKSFRSDVIPIGFADLGTKLVNDPVSFKSGLDNGTLHSELMHSAYKKTNFTSRSETVFCFYCNDTFPPSTIRYYMLAIRDRENPSHSAILRDTCSFRVCFRQSTDQGVDQDGSGDQVQVQGQ